MKSPEQRPDQSATIEDPILRIRDIRKEFGDIVAVEQESLALESGEFFTLIGPSGSGKSTLLRMIAGLEQPTNGTIELAGEDVTDIPPYERETALIFQNFALFPHMSVGENITFPLKMRDVPSEEREQRGKEALEFTDMEGYYDRYPDQLSGGEQQRVALARGLIAEPDVLLLDEPLASLDRKLRQELEIELRKFQRETDITFIYVTHNQEEALTMSDRIAVMNNGIIQQVGTPEEVYSDPETSFVATFLGEANVIPGEIVQVDGDFATLSSGTIRGTGVADDSIKSGDPGQLVVREEDFRLQTVDEDPDNAMLAVVQDIIFQGNSYVYLLEPEGDQTPPEVRARASKHKQTVENIAIQDQVTLTWRSEDAKVFPRRNT